MKVFNTLFDSSYAVKAALMARSLERHSSVPYLLRVLYLDESARERFLSLYCPRGNASLFGWDESFLLEDPHVGEACRRAKANRDHAEWCWTLAAVWTDAAARTYRAPEANTHFVYLDADLYFFSDVEECFREMGDAEVGVVPHRFPPKYAHYAVNGKFNVSMVAFKNSPPAFGILRHWRDQVLERCSRESCGDQKYLDSWPALLGERLHVFRSKGIIPGPWNAWAYDARERDGKVHVDGDRLVAMHFHEFGRDDSMPGGFRRSKGYPMTVALARHVYEPYEREYLEAEAGIKVEAK